MGFSRQEHWSGLPFPSPGNLPDPEIKPESPALQADALLSELPGKAKAVSLGKKKKKKVRIVKRETKEWAAIVKPTGRNPLPPTHLNYS